MSYVSVEEKPPKPPEPPDSEDGRDFDDWRARQPSGRSAWVLPALAAILAIGVALASLLVVILKPASVPPAISTNARLERVVANEQVEVLRFEDEEKQVFCYVVRLFDYSIRTAITCLPIQKG